MIRALFLAALAACLIVSPVIATLQNIGGTLAWPFPHPRSATAGDAFATFSSYLLSASGDKAAFIAQVPVSGTITQVGFRTGTVTTGDTLKVGLETVSATTGHPTGTAYGGSTTTTVVVADVDDNKWFVANIGDATATAGDLFAVVIEFNSYVAGNLNIVRADANNWTSLLSSYNDRFAAAAWTKAGGFPIFTLDYGGTYYPVTNVLPAAGLNDESFNSGTDPGDERGNIVQVPYKCRVVGAWWYGDINDNATIKLYDTDGSTVLASYTQDVDQQSSSTTGIKFVRFSTFGGSCSTPGCVLSVASNYRLTLLPGSTTNSSLGSLDVDATVGAAMMGAMRGGQNIHYTSRTDAGAWSQTTTRRAMIGLLIDQLDDGASAGGATAHTFVR